MAISVELELQASQLKSATFIKIKTAKSWSGKRGSNSRPQPWQGCALPAELFPQMPLLCNSLSLMT